MPSVNLTDTEKILARQAALELLMLGPEKDNPDAHEAMRDLTIMVQDRMLEAKAQKAMSEGKPPGAPPSAKLDINTLASHVMGKGE